MALLVTMEIIIQSLGKKQHSVALIVDSSKAFDSVNHKLLLQRLKSIGLGEMALNWL